MHAERVLLISDFDGTLSEIVPHPDDARLARGAARALALLAKTMLRVCILSSRGTPQLRRLVRVRRVELLGDYGMRSISKSDIDALRRFNQEAGHLATDFAGVTFEQKPGSTAVHFRGAPTVRTKLASVLAPIAKRLDLALSFGRAVIEVRPSAADKSIAAARLIELLEPGAVIFLGDDENDRSVFKLLANLDLPHFSVGVRSEESPRRLFTRCDLVVDGPTEAVGFLSRLAEWAGSPISLPGRAAAGRSSG